MKIIKESQGKGTKTIRELNIFPNCFFPLLEINSKVTNNKGKYERHSYFLNKDEIKKLRDLLDQYN